MQAFIRVVESGTFTKAAQMLDLPKTAVSRLIASIEVELGTKLLNRTTRKVSTTADGAAYYERAPVDERSRGARGHDVACEEQPSRTLARRSARAVRSVHDPSRVAGVRRALSGHRVRVRTQRSPGRPHCGERRLRRARGGDLRSIARGATDWRRQADPMCDAGVLGQARAAFASVGPRSWPCRHPGHRFANQPALSHCGNERS